MNTEFLNVNPGGT